MRRGKPEIVNYTCDGDAYRFSWNGIDMGTFQLKSEVLIADSDEFCSDAWMLSEM